MAELTPSEVLARLALQSDRYATDAEYRDAVDDVLAEAKAAQQPGGWQEIEAEIEREIPCAGHCYGYDQDGRQAHLSTCPVGVARATLAALRPIWERHAAELAAAGAREAGLREVLVAARPRIKECCDEDGDMEPAEAYMAVLVRIDAALAAAPAPAGGLLELLAEAENRRLKVLQERDDGIAHAGIARGRLDELDWLLKQLPSAVGLPPREGV